MLTDEENESVGKVILILVSFGAGVVAWEEAQKLTNDVFLIAASSIVTSLFYPLVGAIVILFCDNLKNWSDPKTDYRWSKAKRLLLGAAFPITLLFSLIIYMFLGVINRA